MSPFRNLVRLAHRGAAVSFDPADDRALLRRYAADRDEGAFTALVERRGPLVLAVCRRALGDPHLAEDAFQATFLILARHAGRLSRRGHVAGWLYVVATRVAGRLGKRRGRHPHPPLTTDPAGTEPARADLDEALRILDEELARLPSRYRAPLVSCYLQERTQDEAARELGWGLNTLRRRLAIGRELLRERLITRGAALSPALIAAAVAANASAIPPARLVADVAVLAPAAAARAPLPSRLAVLVGSTPVAAGRWLAGVAIAMGFGLVIAGAVLWPQPEPPPESDPGPNGTELRDAPQADRDHFEDPLPAGAIARMGTIRFRHPQPQALAFTTDGGGLFALGGGVIRVWDAHIGSEELRFGWPRKAAAGPYGPVKLAALGPDAALLRVEERTDADWAPSLVRWELATARVTRSVRPVGPVGAGTVETMVASPDGRLVAEVWPSRTADGLPTRHIGLRDATTGKFLGRLQSDLMLDGPTERVWAAFAPGGTTLITADDGPRIQVWDIATGARVRSFGTNQTTLAAAALSPDGAHLVTYGLRQKRVGDASRAPDELVRVWDLSTGTVTQELRTGPVAPAHYPRSVLAFTQDGAAVSLVWGTSSARLNVWRWRLADGARTAGWSAPMPALQSAAFSPNGRVLAVSGPDDAVRLFNVDTGREFVVAPEAHPGRVDDVVFRPDGRTVVTAGPDAVRTWTTTSGRALSALSLIADGLSGPNYLDPTGRFVAHRVIRPGQFAVVVREAGTGRPVCSADRPTYWAFSDDGETFVALDGGYAAVAVRVWDLDHPGEVRTIRAKGPITTAPGVGRGRLALSGPKMSFWDLRTGDRVAEWADDHIRRREPRESPFSPPRSDSVWRMALSPDGAAVYLLVWRLKESPGERCAVYRCDVATGQVRWWHPFPDRYDVLAVAPDGTRVAVGGPDVMVLDTATGNRLSQFDGHPGTVTSVRFSADGRRLASSATDGTAVIWDVSRR